MSQFPEEMRGSISPEVHGIVFVCNDLDDKGRLVIGVHKNGRRPVVVAVCRKVLQGAELSKADLRRKTLLSYYVVRWNTTSTGMVPMPRWVHGFVDRKFPRE